MFLKANPTSEWKYPTIAEINDERISCESSNADLPKNQFKNCVRKCLLEKTGLFNETNGFNVENIVKLEMHEGRSDSAAKAVVKKCAVKKKESENNCDWALRGLECLIAEKHTQLH